MNYWDALNEATSLIEKDALRNAERLYDEARERRERSPGRVFLSERVGDAARRLWGRLGRRDAESAGRWQHAERDFREAFATAAESLLDRVRPRVDAGQPVPLRSLDEVAFLTLQSALHHRDVELGSRCLLGALQVSAAEGDPLSPEILPAAGLLPLDDVEAVARAGAVQMELLPGTAAEPVRRVWAESLIALLDDLRLRQRPDLHAAVLLLTARLTDLGLDDRPAAAAAYRDYLAAAPSPSAERDEAQLRAAALFANIGVLGHDVPRYAEALDVLDEHDPTVPGTRARARVLREAVAARGRVGREGVWATLEAAGDLVVAVLWHDDRPCDAALLRREEDAAAFRTFLAPAADRVLVERRDPAWPGLEVAPLAETLLEPLLNTLGRLSQFDDEAAAAIALTDHPLASVRDETVAGSVSAALACGRLWLRVLHGMRRADADWRAGVHRLARLGDPASAFVSGFLPPELMPTEEWRLATLDARPDPTLLLNEDSPMGPGLEDGPPMPEARAVVATGHPERILASWGVDRDRWRIVLDRPDRLAELAAVVRVRGGGLTVLPAERDVDDPRRALAALVGLASATAGAGDPDCLPLFLWNRLCATHNGDLADFARLRLRRGRGTGLWDRFLAWLHEHRLQVDDGEHPWRTELETRCAGSSVVVGGDHDLTEERGVLSRRWGVTAGAPGHWIVCDAAVVAWRLARRDPEAPARLHGALAAFSAGRLDVVTAAVALREELLERLALWMGHGDPVIRRSFTDIAPAMLELAGDGPEPDARVALGPLVEGVIELARRHGRQEPADVIVRRETPLGGVLAAHGRGEFADGPGRPVVRDADEFWTPGEPVSGRTLVVTRLESLDRPPGGDDLGDEPDSWAARDAVEIAADDDRRALLALELAAWSARTLGGVGVADTRWWRAVGYRIRGEEHARLLDAEGACEALSAPSAVVVPLPEASAGRSPVADWLRNQGWIEADGLGLPEACPQAAASAMRLPEGSAVITGVGDRTWPLVLRELWRLKESGSRQEWALVVAETPPAGLRELVAGTPRPAASTALGSGPGTPWAPVVWIRPADLADAALRRRLAAAAPSLVWATDLRAWLPSDHGARTDISGALGFLLREAGARVLLHATLLPAAWRDVWPELAGPDGPATVVDEDDGGEAAAPDAAAVPVMRFDHPTLVCPDCGVEHALKTVDDHCERCGLHLLTWLSPTIRADLLADLRRAKIAALAARETGDGPPLCLWIPSREFDVWTELLDEAGRPWRRAVSRSLGRDDLDGSWLVCLLDGTLTPPAECRHAVLAAPENEAELATLRRVCGDDLALWYHPLETAFAGVGLGRRRDDDQATAADVDLAPPTRLTAPWTWSGWLPPECQEIVSGLPAAHLRRLAGAAAWMDAVIGEGPRTSRTGNAGGRLEVRLGGVELDYRFGRCRSTTAQLLPHLLLNLRPGGLGVIDLAELPFELEAEDVAWTDRVLLVLSRRLQPAGRSGGPQLVYEPDGGLARTTRRRVGFLGRRDEVVAAVLALLDSLMNDLVHRIAREEDGTALDDAEAARDRDVLAAGVLLGVWSQTAPAGPDDLHVQPGGRREGRRRDAPDLAVRLYAAEQRERRSWEERLDEAWRVGFYEQFRAVRAEPPAIRGEDPDHPDDVVRRLAAFLKSARPGLRIVEGPVAGARQTALIRALEQAGPCVRDVDVVAPDYGTAARFHLAWRRLRPHAPVPRIGVPSREDLPVQDLGAEVFSPVRPEAVQVVLALESMAPALRYRLAQNVGDRRILCLFEPFLFDDSREHLLLDKPAADEVLQGDRIFAASRAVRDELADWVEVFGGGRELGRSRAKDKGWVEARPVANLDNALAVLDETCREHGLAAPVDVVAPSLGDLDYLGRAAARQCWLPVYRWELDALLMPGALEFTAAVCDAADAPGDGDDGDDRPLRLAALLPPALRADYRRWRRTVRADQPLDAFYASMARAGFAESFLLPTVNRRRVEALTAAAGEVDVARFAARSLIEVWRLAVSDLPGQPPVEASGPMLTLCTPEHLGGGRAATVVHLCSGVEPARFHYRIGVRAEQGLLLLHQTRSPLRRDVEEG